MSSTSYRNSSIITSFPYNFDGIGLFYRDTASAMSNGMFWNNMSFMNIFAWEIWILTFACTIITTLLSVIGRKMELVRWVSCLWFIIANILLSVFTNLMAINFVAPVSTSGRPFSTLEDLGSKIHESDCRFVLPKSFENADEIIYELVNPKIADNSVRKLFQCKYTKYTALFWQNNLTYACWGLRP